MKNNKTKQTFIELRAAGYSFDHIAKQLGVAKSTLIDWSKEFQHEIANLKAIEMESLQEQYYVVKRARIEIIGDQTKKLKEELIKRDLGDIPTEKLYDLLLKYMQWLKQEEVEPVFQRQKEDDVEDMIKNTLTTVERWKAN
ncbi:helix-turn-helix domain-containing protein [Pseudalkalibacillus sp. JSM 102089]|uniref:helix-turn-helix domain-containing protein n=1 Tax=Pseudalkalibacillus sp. JSM 102089 TaxID=3229856 RepID=UPI00352611FC